MEQNEAKATPLQISNLKQSDQSSEIIDITIIVQIVEYAKFNLSILTFSSCGSGMDHLLNI